MQQYKSKNKSGSKDSQQNMQVSKSTMKQIVLLSWQNEKIRDGIWKVDILLLYSSDIV